MSDAPERNTVIDLLDKLGSERDEDVLAAARALHALIAEAGMNWQDLLVGDDGSAPDEPAIDDFTDDEDDDDDIEDDEDDTEDDEDDIEDDTGEPATKFVASESETGKLIDKLLARDGNSEGFREELEEYKADLTNGDLDPSDHRYIQALYARLTNSR